MAIMTFKAGEEYAMKLSRLADYTGRIEKRAIYEAAGMVADKVKSNLKENIDDPAFAGIGSTGSSGDNQWGIKKNLSTGDLIESLGITEITRDIEGNWNAKVGFDGYDRKGVPNQLKARAMESGTSTLRKRPFVRPAVKTVKPKAIAKMNEIIEEEIAKITK